MVGSDLVGNGQPSKVLGDLDSEVVVDDVESLDHALLNNLFVALAKFECGGTLREVNQPIVTDSLGKERTIRCSFSMSDNEL